ncbi:hypothetical protein BC830DRAFT_1087045 [Chytriomyces sp. MP71]|nr:hypothetical protein BC830DRAFT_1087045 [Chytriomyces sp. MP71]
MDWKQLFAARDVLKMRFADKEIKYEDKTRTMWEIKIDLGEIQAIVAQIEKGGSFERGYSTMDEALDAINQVIMLKVLNGKDKESGWDVQKAATAKQQKQVEEHVEKAIMRLLNEDHATVAQNYNNKSKK